jgi:lipopolysaccharide transport system ATP-binding protein
MSDLAVRTKQLSKAYRISHKRNGRPLARYKTLQEEIVTLPSRLLSGFRKQIDGDRETVWALEDASFDVYEGEVIGIIGRNGAGKSTLLKILSRITDPTKGSVEIYGRIGSLLEVGTGFHPELTGRENIFLNGAIIGMRRHEIAKKFDEIVAFAEVEKFIDTPVKYYSSGMYVRLAFSVAAHLEPDILVVDEVLAVGDVEFQKKSLGRMQAVAGEGRTVLFVSHNLGAIQSLCQRVLWLNNGRIMSDGPSKQVIQQYMESANTASVLYQPEPHLGYDDLVINKILLKNSLGQVTSSVSSGEVLHIEIHYHALKRLEKPYFWIIIRSKFGSLYGANMLFDNARPDYIEGEGVIGCTFSPLGLVPQTYTIRLGVRHQNGINNYIGNAESSFVVTGTAEDLGMAGEMAHNFFEDFYSVLVPYSWHLPDGKIVPVNGYRAH